MVVRGVTFDYRQWECVFSGFYNDGSGGLMGHTGIKNQNRSRADLSGIGEKFKRAWWQKTTEIQGRNCFVQVNLFQMNLEEDIFKGGRRFVCIVLLRNNLYSYYKVEVSVNISKQRVLYGEIILQIYLVSSTKIYMCRCTTDLLVKNDSIRSQSCSRRCDRYVAVDKSVRSVALSEDQMYVCGGIMQHMIALFYPKHS